MLEKPNKELCKQIQNTFQDLDLTSLVININPLKTNVIMGKEKIVLIGQDYITDYLLGKEFRISSNSFYQINHQQTERLYQTVIDFCDFKGDEVVLDAYCGIGTIALSLSQYVKKVYGIEIVQDAIDMAKDNARLNSVKNCEFEAAAVEDVIEEYKRLHLDVVVVDPPRKGLDEKSIQQFIEINPKKIVYVSCNPNTLVRDLKMLSFNYQLVKIQPVDMFPMTVHVECIALIQRVKS